MNKRKWLGSILLVTVTLILLIQGCTGIQGQATISPLQTAPSAPYNLTILHTSENHGHWESTEISKVSQGGIARRATLIKKIRAEFPNSLLVDSGDISQGTRYYTLYKGAEGCDFYNLLGYDAAVTGNHEFDDGPKTLADNFVNRAKFSIIVANMNFSGEPTLAGKIPATVIKIVGGEKIGLFGLITDEVTSTSSPGPNIVMKDTVQSANESIAELNRKGVNKVILLSHLGFPADQELAGKVDGIDVIISGHTDTLMGDPIKLDPSLGKPISPYPAAVMSPNGGKTLIVHDFTWGRLLGQLNVTFNSTGEITSWNGDPILVDKNISEDPVVAQKLKELEPPNPVIGKTSVNLEGKRAVVRNQESNLGNLAADAVLWSTRKDKTQIALINGGGIRAGIPQGDITESQVREALPFGNRLVQFDLSGADILAALENSISTIKSDPEESGGRFLQVGGLKFSADLNKSVGSRITEVLLGSESTGYKPLDKAETYRVVSLDYMLGGGDGYTMLKNGKNIRGGDVPEEQAVIEYIMAYSPVSPRVEGRITLLQ
jgi:5'-nucleotidase / UDP-sugar diphosphatase